MFEKQIFVVSVVVNTKSLQLKQMKFTCSSTQVAAARCKSKSYQRAVFCLPVSCRSWSLARGGDF